MTKLTNLIKEQKDKLNSSFSNQELPMSSTRSRLENFLTICQQEIINKIKTDLLAIADQGEYEDLRREVLNYFEIT